VKRDEDWSNRGKIWGTEEYAGRKRLNIRDLLWSVQCEKSGFSNASVTEGRSAGVCGAPPVPTAIGTLLRLVFQTQPRSAVTEGLPVL